MEKDSFLDELLKRAKEQHIVLHDVPLPGFFLFVSKRFGEYPWKILIPLSACLATILHLLMGKSFDESILWLFGGL